jgi:hypothetical protein
MSLLATSGICVVHGLQINVVLSAEVCRGTEVRGGSRRVCLSVLSRAIRWGVSAQWERVLRYLSKISRDLRRTSPLTAAAPQDGWTALHMAAVAGHAVVVRTLLDAGADGEAQSKVSGILTF